MKILIIVAVLFCAICVYSYYKEKEKQEAEEYGGSIEYVDRENDNNQTKKETKNMKTKELLFEVLKKLGCQYEIDEDGTINFMWQGGNFSVDADNDSAFIVVWFLFWDEYKQKDTEIIKKVKQAINRVNTNRSVSVIYSERDDDSILYVHSKKHMIFVPEIPAPEEYFQFSLGEFFRVRQYFEIEMEKLRLEDKKKEQSRQ